MPKRREPTARSSTLAALLRELRKASTLSTTQVGQALGWDQTKISKIENEHIGVSLPDLEKVLDLYGVSSSTRANLTQLAREADKRGWWTDYGDEIFADAYPALEDRAVMIREWQSQVIPGLLQTPAYARRVIAAGQPNASADHVEQRLRARMARKPLLERQQPPRVYAIIDQAVIQRGMAADPTVMVPQIRALLDAPENVTVRILPFANGWHAGTDSSMTILSFGSDLMDKPFIEGVGGSLFVESVMGLARCDEVWNALLDSALSTHETHEWLTNYLEGQQR